MNPTCLEELLVISIILSIIVLGLWIYWAYKSKQLIYFAIPVVLLLVNEIIFDIFRLASPPVLTSFFTMWSLGIRIQAVLTLLAGIVIMIRGKVGYGYK